MEISFTDNGTRRQYIHSIKRIVVKIGTRLLMDVKNEKPLNRIRQLIAQIAELRRQGIEVVLVSSGAIGAALTILNTRRRPKRIPALQAYAALGQCHMMTMYEEACSEFGFHCGQLLLTSADLKDHDRHVSFSQCLEELIEQKMLPIINENDSVCVDEIKVGDNDTLASLVGSMCRADLTILLTTIDGLKERNEQTGELGRRISIVKKLDDTILQMAQGTDGNSFSTGGMITKLHAAAITTSCGEPLWIAEGFDFSILQKIISGEDIGTLFLPQRSERLHAFQRYLAFFSNPSGDIIIDKGAEEALIQQGKSLLSSGILGVRGHFNTGEVVRIINIEHKEIARGTVNYSTGELSQIAGANTQEIENRLGHKPKYTEVVHRNSLVLI